MMPINWLGRAGKSARPSCKWNECVPRQFPAQRVNCHTVQEEGPMNGIIYIVGLIVVIMFILSFLGLR